MPTWSQVTFEPSHTSLAAVQAAWAWKLGAEWQPLLCSVLGDVFIELPAGTVWWLSTATGALEQVADNRSAFERLLESDRAQEWFLPGLVAVLRQQGQRLRRDQCYSYAVFPVFAEGSFSAENMHPLPAAEHFTRSGRLHRQIQALPDGVQVAVRTRKRLAC